MNVDWKQVAALTELGGNVALTILGAEGITPSNTATLAAGIEAAVNPLMSALATGKPASRDVILGGYGALIGTLSTLKDNTSLPKDVLTKIDEYISAASAGTVAYLAAEQKYDPSLFQVDPAITVKTS